SISQMTSQSRASAHRNPARYAPPSPLLTALWSTVTRGSVSARRSAHDPVPSGEPSSTTSTWTSGAQSSRAASVRGSESISLYVGITTRVFIGVTLAERGVGPVDPVRTSGNEYGPAAGPSGRRREVPALSNGPPPDLAPVGRLKATYPKTTAVATRRHMTFPSMQTRRSVV